MTYRIVASRHSAFYSPLLYAVVLLRRAGHLTNYGVLQPGQRTYELLGHGTVDIIQSAVSSNWALIEKGIEPRPVHFAQINCRDGFFLVGREANPAFEWKKLEGRTLRADHGLQPLVMLKYAVQHNGVDWGRIRVVESGDADYSHQQGPVEGGEIVASVGASMPEVAFSSLCCWSDYRETPQFDAFLKIYGVAREFVRTAPPEEIAEAEASFFPGVSGEKLADTIRRYQSLGTWDGGIEIPAELYEQALNVFESQGAISRRYQLRETQA